MGTDLIWKALAPHVPQRLGAGHMVSVCGTTIWSQHPDTGVQTLFVQPLVGGWGAESDRDGQNGQFSSADGETYNLPVEIIEKRYGIRVEEYTFHNDDGGAGKFRGGKGCSLKLRIMSDEALITASFGRSDHPAWGVGGGQQGSPNYFEVYRTDGSVERYSIVNKLPLFKGDLLRLVTATGGGWGDPKDRTQAAIENDLKNGFVTNEQVTKHYC